MMQRPFTQVDVFTTTPYYGNPLAVVLDGQGLDDTAMQRFAHWTHLSETVFILPPTEPGRAAGADYRVRIFTPAGELPFAGHPTLGACHAWLQTAGRGHIEAQVIQECAVGLVPIRRQGQLLAFAAPPLRQSTPDAPLLGAVIAALGLQPPQVLAARRLDNGPVWLGLLLDSIDTVLALTPDHARLNALGHKVGVAALAPPSDTPQLISRTSREARAFPGHETPHLAEPDLEVRAFAAPVGIPEDPVTGSLNASLAQWLMAEGRAPTRYLAAQGTCLGRAGRVHVERDAQGQVWVGGATVTCIEGQVSL